MHPIQMKMIKFLSDSIESPQDVDENLIEEFGERCKEVLRKQFVNKRPEGFTIRMSNMGKPLCQLRMEKMGVPPEPMAYNMKVKFTYGDLAEALLVFILKASGVKIQAEQVPVDLPIGGIIVEGTLDQEIDDAVYDCKSASKFAFDRKFGPAGGISAISDNDGFGYVAQLLGYSRGYEKPPGGWITLNKETGEVHVSSADGLTPESQTRVLGLVDQNIRSLLSTDAFERCFRDKEENFKKKPTGNYVLDTECRFCPYKYYCWPGLEYRPKIMSEAENPTWEYYTYIDPKYRKVNNDDNVSVSAKSGQ